ncbi:MAG: TlyA family RNA methyltransferase [Oscillospiraceae bacterium]|nr:TlyA family RNA methyltransferase [Oscillospiraceae bacterium]
MKKVRLDQLVFDLGLTPSRERARTTIMSGVVFADGKRADKPGSAVSPDSVIELRGDKMPYVSRGGLKLEKALEVFPADPSGKCCIDCGASTGGFTDVLLRNGARKVYAVDVGYGQLAWSLRNDPRVVSMERTNIRYIKPDMIPDEPEFAVVDLSFISVRLILKPLFDMLPENGETLCLIKPQFEAGKEKVGKKGVVRDKKIHAEVINEISGAAKREGFTVAGLDFSPVKGPEGNIEYLIYLIKNAPEQKPPDAVSVTEAAECYFERKT